MLKVFGIGMVRNEADVVELWARYNLRLLDGLIVIDHASIDNTYAILEALQKEGLPIFLARWSDHQYSQAEAIIQTVRPFVARKSADYFIPLDADELLGTTPASLREALAVIPEGHVGAIPWRTYLPERSATDRAFFRSMYRYRSAESQPNIKVITPARYLHDSMWSAGSHGLFRTSDGADYPVKTLPFFLAHYPVRSAQQIMIKTALGALAARLKDPRKRIVGEACHWLDIEAKTRHLLDPTTNGAIDEHQLDSDRAYQLIWNIALGYANAVHDEALSPQIVVEGAIADFPEIVQRYTPEPLDVARMRQLKSDIERQFAAQLSEVGFYEFNAGNSAWREGDHVSALAHYRDASRLNPSLAQAELGKARCFVKLGDWMNARQAFAECLKRDPNHFSAWLEAGHLCRQMGVAHQAAGAYQRAIQASPERYEALFALARVLPELGDPAGGDQAFKQALELLRGKPDAAASMAEAAHRMGQYRLEQGEVQRAIEALRLGLAVMDDADRGNRPGDQAGPSDALLARKHEIEIDLGEAFWRLGMKQEAFAAFSSASSADVESTLARLGVLSFRLNLWQEAIAVLRRNVERHPQSVHAHWNLAHLLAECWQMDEAERVLKSAQALGEVAGASSLRAAMAGKRGDARAALALYQQCVRESKGSNAFRSSVAMSSLYCDHLSANEVMQLHKDLFAALGEGARSRESFRRATWPGRKLRIGLVSADFHHQHPVNIFMQPVLREYDRGSFEVFMYFNGVSYDEQTRLAKQRVDHWVECSTLNDAQLAARIDIDRIDVLVDLAGHTGQQRMAMFAKRAAPVQVTYLGYPGSTGVPNVDWLIGDEVVTPKEYDSLYSERVWRLPGVVFCYAPEDTYPESDWSEEHIRRPLTFGSFNNVPKLTPRTLQLWSRILDSVGGSRLLLKAPSFTDPGAVQAFSGRLENLGVDLTRVMFRGPTGLAEMMAEYADVDIALDPVPYNGGTTSMQALWMGVPVVVMRGQHFVSRMGASFMTAAGLGDWIASDDGDFVRIAQDMAADRRKLFALKKNLRSHLKRLSAWDPKQQTRAIESAWISMYRSAMTGGTDKAGDACNAEKDRVRREGR